MSGIESSPEYQQEIQRALAFFWLREAISVCAFLVVFFGVFSIPVILLISVITPIMYRLSMILMLLMVLVAVAGLDLLNSRDRTVTPEKSLNGHYVSYIDQLVARLPDALVSARIADEEIGDTREFSEARLIQGESEFRVVMFFLGCVLVAIINTQRARLKRTVERRQTK